MPAKNYPIGASIVENDGSNLGDYLGFNIGKGLVAKDQGQILGLEAEVEGYETIHFRCDTLIRQRSLFP